MSKDIAVKDIESVLEELAVSEQFTITLTDQNSYTFRCLSTSQFKRLVQTVVDSPLTQSIFNTTLSKIMKECYVTGTDLAPRDANTFTVIDRLIFCLSVRILSLSPILHDSATENEEHVIDLESILKKVQATSTKPDMQQLFAEQAFVNDTLTVTYAIPTLGIDLRLNEELYKDQSVDISTPDQLRKIIGEAFINEIAKTITAVKTKDSTLDFSSMNFKQRLKIVEKLPAQFTQQVVKFIENYKKPFDDCLVLSENKSLSIDGSLFSMR